MEYASNVVSTLTKSDELEALIVNPEQERILVSKKIIKLVEDMELKERDITCVEQLCCSGRLCALSCH